MGIILDYLRGPEFSSRVLMRGRQREISLQKRSRQVANEAETE